MISNLNLNFPTYPNTFSQILFALFRNFIFNSYGASRGIAPEYFCYFQPVNFQFSEFG